MKTEYQEALEKMPNRASNITNTDGGKEYRIDIALWLNSYYTVIEQALRDKV